MGIAGELEDRGTATPTDPYSSRLVSGNFSFAIASSAQAMRPCWTRRDCRWSATSVYHEEKARGGLAMTMIGGSAMTSPDSSWGGGQLDLSRTASFRICVAFRAHPSAWRRRHVPGLPSREEGDGIWLELAPGACAITCPGNAQPELSKRNGSCGYHTHRPGLCRCRAALHRGRAGRGGNCHRRTPHRPISISAYQQAH